MAPKLSLYKETKLKETPIGRIPNKWGVVTLGDVIKYTKGTKPKTLLTREEQDTLPYLTADVMRTGKFTQWSKESGDLVRVHKDDVILIWDGFYCGDAFIGFEGILSSTMIKIDPEISLDKRFLFYLLKTHFKELNTKISGMYLKHISKSVFEGLKLPLPLLEEQQKIAEVLSTFDEAIQKTNEVIAKTGRLKKGLMQELLTKGMGHREFKNTEIGRIPRDWDVVKLNEIGILKDGDWILQKYYSSEGVRLIQIGDIGTGEFLDKSDRFISYESATKLNCTFVKPNEDILISRMPDPIGRACLAPELPHPYIVAVDITIFSLNDDQADREFITHALNSPKTLDDTKRLASGATRLRISRRHLENIKIPLPKRIDEQKTIAEILSTIDKKLELERNEKIKLERIKQGVMDLLLTGKIRVRVH